METADDKDRDENADENRALADWTQALRTVVLGAARPDATGALPASEGVRYGQARLLWSAARGKVRRELRTLADAILAHYSAPAAQADIAAGVRKLDTVLELFDDSLDEVLDAASNAADTAARAPLHDRARVLIARYQGFLHTDPLVRELDANPFVPIAAQATLSATLALLDGKLR